MQGWFIPPIVVPALLVVGIALYALLRAPL
jgi:hypothetical protein